MSAGQPPSWTPPHQPQSGPPQAGAPASGAPHRPRQPWPSRQSGVLRGGAEVLVALVDRVLVDPVREGRLRASGWPRGLAAIIGCCLVLYGVLAVVTITGPVLRQALPAGASAFGIAPDLLTAAMAATAFLAALLVTGAMHAPVGLKLTGLAAPLLFFSAQAQLADTVDQQVVSGVALLVLVAFQLLRWGRPFAWWDFVVNLAVVAAATVWNLATIVRPALAAGRSDASFLVVMTVISVGVLGLGYAVTSGAATAEVAFTSSVWFVEFTGRRFGRRVSVAVVAFVAVLAWAGVLWRLTHAPLPGWLYGVQILLAAGVVGLSWGCWVLIDRATDARAQRVGRPASDTDVGDLTDAFRPLAFWTGIALAAPQALNIVWGNLERGLWLGLRAAGVEYVPGDLVTRLALGADTARGLIVAGYLVAVLLCLAALIGGYRRGLRGQASLAGVLAVFALLATLTRAGVPLTGPGLDTLSAAMVLISTGVAVVWQLSGRLTVPRGRAIGVALLLSAAVLGRDLVADPIGALLGGSGGVLLVFGLLWALLTGAGDANGDSPSFPRAARALLIVGWLTLTMLIAATDAVAVTFAVDLDRFVRAGVEIIGTGLLAAGLWAVLTVAGRRR